MHLADIAVKRVNHAISYKLHQSITKSFQAPSDSRQRVAKLNIVILIHLLDWDMDTKWTYTKTIHRFCSMDHM